MRGLLLLLLLLVMLVWLIVCLLRDRQGCFAPVTNLHVELVIVRQSN